MKNSIFFSLLIICVVIMATVRSQASSERSGGIADEAVVEYYHRPESNPKRARRALITRVVVSAIDALLGGGVGITEGLLNVAGIGAGDDDLNDDYAINLEH